VITQTDVEFFFFQSRWESTVYGPSFLYMTQWLTVHGYINNSSIRSHNYLTKQPYVSDKYVRRFYLTQAKSAQAYALYMLRYICIW